MSARQRRLEQMSLPQNTPSNKPIKIIDSPMVGGKAKVFQTQAYDSERDSISPRFR